jgi:hypothetical protein
MSLRCPWLLTAGTRAGRGVLEFFERRVYFEGLREMLGTLRANPVAAEAANEVERAASEAVDNHVVRLKHIPQRL